MNDSRFAIVGAGLAGLSCARVLVAAGYQPRLFEAEDLPGGRLATFHGRRAAWDHGAQYFTVSDPGFAGLLREAQANAMTAAWTPRWPGGEQLQRELWVGVPGIDAFPRWLAAGLEVEGATRVVSLRRDGGAWTLQDGRDRLFQGFDFVILALPPIPAALLGAPHSALARRVAAVPMAPCWTVMAAFAAPLPVMLDADFSADPLLPWVARNSSKPGREGADAWVLHADAGWSGDHQDAEPAWVGGQLLGRLAARIDTVVPEPVEIRTYLWRHARVMQPLGEDCLFDEAAGIGFCGDWCLDARVEAAWLSGRALGQRLLRQVTG